MSRHVQLQIEYSNGKKAARTFHSRKKALEWVHNEGDHVVNYSVIPLGLKSNEPEYKYGGYFF